MNKVKVLDCSLRDGGYCNDWNFGLENIKKIITGLCSSKIEMIECGFLTQKESYISDRTVFTDLNQLKQIIYPKNEEQEYVVMINYGEYNLNKLPINNGETVDGIRLAFHKNTIDNALRDSIIIKEKGYKLFLQPMVTQNYSDEEFIQLIKNANNINPYALYIVDSFGTMKQNDLQRYLHLMKNNLSENISIGFHSHNNLQMAYLNSQLVVSIPSKHNLIIDSSAYGMGRGAGNLNTELFIDYLNENYNGRYQIEPILNIIDEILNDFYLKKPWGYSLVNYLSAIHNCHPNYAAYLSEKNTLTINEMNRIFSLMSIEKKSTFDKKYIENLYSSTMSNKLSYIPKHKEKLISILAGKTVVLIATGKSSITEKDKIINFIEKNNAVVFSINTDIDYLDKPFIFLSNFRRYREIEKDALSRCIITSNINDETAYMQIEYSELINSEEYVQDNAGLMAIKFLQLYGVNSIYLAGFDGYSHDDDENYSSTELTMIAQNDVLDKMNTGMEKILFELSKKVNIRFLTEPQKIHLKNS